MNTINHNGWKAHFTKWKGAWRALITDPKNRDFALSTEDLKGSTEECLAAIGTKQGHKVHPIQTAFIEHDEYRLWTPRLQAWVSILETETKFYLVAEHKAKDGIYNFKLSMEDYPEEDELVELLEVLRGQINCFKPFTI